MTYLDSNRNPLRFRNGRVQNNHHDERSNEGHTALDELDGSRIRELVTHKDLPQVSKRGRCGKERGATYRVVDKDVEEREVAKTPANMDWHLATDVAPECPRVQLESIQSLTPALHSTVVGAGNGDIQRFAAAYGGPDAVTEPLPTLAVEEDGGKKELAELGDGDGSRG